MPLTTRAVSYDITQFTGGEYPAGGAFLRITPTRNSVVDGHMIPAVAVIYTPDASGQGVANLASSEDGTPQFAYNATVLVNMGPGVSGQYLERDFGLFSVPSGVGDLDIGDLLADGSPPADTSYWSQITEAQYNEIIDAAASAVAAAAAAALYAPAYFDTKADLLADTAAWPDGTILNTRVEGLAYEVLASGAIDFDETTAGGEKLLLQSTVANLPGAIYAPYVSKTARIHSLFGVLRQDPTDRTQWQFLNDSAHSPLGFDPTYPLYAVDGITPINPKAQSGTNLLVFYKLRTDEWQTTMSPALSYPLVGYGIVTADELLTKEWGITLGAQVTRTGLTISGGMAKTRHARIYYSGSAWVVTNDALQTFGTVTTSYDSGTGVLTVTHDWLPGENLRIEADARSGLITTLHTPIRRQVVSTTSFTVQFRDATGAIVTGAPTNAMALRATKSYNGPLYFDGTNGFDNIPWSTSGAGNIWISVMMWIAA